MRKFLYHLFILVGLFFSPLSHAQIVLEALEKPTGCSAIPSFHPFHKVTRGNYKWDGTFADPYTGEGSAYMSSYEAWHYNWPTGYHLPTMAEWLTIMPPNDVWKMGNNSTRLNVSESHQFGKISMLTTTYKNFKGDYYKANDGTLYGIRFKPTDPHSEINDNNYMTAYKYKHTNEAIIVDIKYIGDQTVSLDEITSDAFWDADTCTDAFYFLKMGYYTTKCNWGGVWDDPYSTYCFMPGRTYYWMYDGWRGNTWWWDSSAGFDRDGSDYLDTIRLFRD